LRETVRRRRATGGPAEHAFSSLVGLELRPRRLREAATLWALLKAERGVEGRDAVWHHPDLLPTAEDLEDPQGFSERRKLAEASDSEVDDALQKLLNGGFDEPADTEDTDAEDTTGSKDTTESKDTAESEGDAKSEGAAGSAKSDDAEEPGASGQEPADDDRQGRGPEDGGPDDLGPEDGGKPKP
jgi:Zincin-like metallopeptidase